MTTLNAFYVRGAQDNSAIEAAIRSKFPSAKIVANKEFWGVTLPEEVDKAPEHHLTELSLHLGTDVLWLSFQSTVDAFEFHHWRGGQHLRSLAYGCFVEERTWALAEGTPEPWERAVFFDPKGLERAKQELERIWREAEILAGRTEPLLIARRCAIKVAEHFHLPGWGL
jgi:hypothetical protein